MQTNPHWTPLFQWVRASDVSNTRSAGRTYIRRNLLSKKVLGDNGSKEILIGIGRRKEDCINRWQYKSSLIPDLELYPPNGFCVRSALSRDNNLQNGKCILFVVKSFEFDLLIHCVLKFVFVLVFFFILLFLFWLLSRNLHRTLNLSVGSNSNKNVINILICFIFINQLQKATIN